MVAGFIASACNIRVAKHRVVKLGDQEYEKIHHVGFHAEIVGSTNEHKVRGMFFGIHEGFKQFDNVMSMGVFCVLEYVQGHPFMGPEVHNALVNPDPNMLEELGRLCAFDVLVNNLDRIPLPVWQNEGNLGNVMIVNGGHRVVGIDQQVNPVVAQYRDGYLQKVRKIVESTWPEIGDPAPVIASIRCALLQNCGAELSDASASILMRGLHQGFESITYALLSGELQRSIDDAAVYCKNNYGDEALAEHETAGVQYALVRSGVDDLGLLQDFVISTAREIAAAFEEKRVNVQCATHT